MATGGPEDRTAELPVPERFVERRGRARARVPVLTILYHPDLDRVGERLWLSPLLSGAAVGLSRLAPGFSAPGGQQPSRPRPLDDPYLSRTPLRFAAGGGEGEVTLEPGESQTPVFAEGGPLSEPRTFGVGELEEGVVLILAKRVVLLLHSLPPRSRREPPRFDLIGDSDALLRVRQEIERVADLEVPVLLRGETGTGKELIARALHQASLRRNRPYLSVNLGAVPPTLAAAELFGSIKGAFTGADKNRTGYFQRAHGGTLFLDEVGEAPPEVQVLLLRVLEQGEIQPVGSLDPQRVDVRVIAATDVDLEQAIESGRFKAPLLHRLSGYSIHVPPLRVRRDDVGRLLAHFLREELALVGEERRLTPEGTPERLWLPASIVARLVRYPWPGNVRELRNLVRQMVIESRGADQVRVGPQVEQVLRRAEGARRSPAEAAAAAAAEPENGGGRPERRSYRPPSEVSDDELVEALRAHRWLVKPAAAELGVSRPSLYALIDRCPRVRKAVDLTREEIEASRARTGGALEAMVDELEVSKNGLQMRMKELGMGPSD